MKKDTQVYQVVEAPNGYDVVGPSERAILSCRDSASAEHYAELLSRAYQQGYKEGYRAAKSAK